MPILAYSIQNILKRAQQLDISTAFQPFSGVEIDTGAQDNNGNEIIYTAGDSSGRVLTIYNEWGTQAQANNILADIKGFAYQPYTASGALVDPSAELGDGVSVNDVYSGIYRISRNYSSLMSADIQAPQSEEIDHEYPYESTQSRETTRKFSAMESELSMNAGKIEAKVSKQSPEGQTSFSWDLTDSYWVVKRNGSVIFKVDANGAQVAGKITASSGKIGGFDIGTSAITYNGLTWNGNKTGIYLGPTGLQLGSASSSFFQASASGNVRAHNMTLTGTLYFKDGNGVTKSMNANDLRAGAQSAYSNGGTWTNTSNGWNGATGTNLANAIGRFNCKLLYVTGNVIYLDGTGAYWQEKEVRLANGGTSKIIYLGRATV